jgi:protein SCO1/2
MKTSNIIHIIIFVSLSVGCSQIKNELELPVLGRSEIVEREVDGVMVYDTIPHMISDFQFVDQDSSIITN